MRTKKFYDYTVQEDGVVLGKNGKPLTPVKSLTGTSIYTMYINGKIYQKPAKRLIYMVFHPEENIDRAIVYSRKKDSLHIDDLYTVNRDGRKFTDYIKMQSKKDIFNKMIEYDNAGEYELSGILEWVLGKKKAGK